MWLEITETLHHSSVDLLKMDIGRCWGTIACCFARGRAREAMGKCSGTASLSNIMLSALQPSAASRLSAARSGVLHCAAINMATHAPMRTFSPGAAVVLACVLACTMGLQRCSCVFRVTNQWGVCTRHFDPSFNHLERSYMTAAVPYVCWQISTLASLKRLL